MYKRKDMAARLPVHPAANRQEAMSLSTFLLAVESFLDDIKGMESEAGSIKALIEEYKEKHRNHSKIYYPNISLAFEDFHLVLPAYAGL